MSTGETRTKELQERFPWLTTVAAARGVQVQEIIDEIDSSRESALSSMRAFDVPGWTLDVPEHEHVWVCSTCGNHHDRRYRNGRQRLTPDHLRQVADAYRVAFLAGESPTQGVADKFGVPYSTATKWVVRARKSGALGPADSTRGGEVEHD